MITPPPRRSGDLAEARTLYRQALELRAERNTPVAWAAVARAQDRLAALLLATYPLPRRRGHRRQR